MAAEEPVESDGMSADEARERLYEALAAAGPQHTTSDEGMGDAMLTGWAVCCEWVDANGEPWMSKLSGDVQGKKLAVWREEGLLHHALYGNWNGTSETED